MGQQGFSTVRFEGGLDLINTHVTYQSQPGTCSVLKNFECSIDGGYRRINGFTKFGTAQPTGTSTRVLGVFPYADGVVAVAGTGVYFSTDGTTWVQVNRDTYTAKTGTVEVANTHGTYVDIIGTGTSFTTEYQVGDHVRIAGNIREISEIISNTHMHITEEILPSGVVAGTAHYKNGTTSLAGTVATRTSQDIHEFAWLEDDGTYGSLVMTDTSGNNNAGRLKITGTGGSRTYSWDNLNADFAAPLQPKHCCTLHQRVIFADCILDSVREPSTVAWSDRYQNLRFDGASAGTIQCETPIVGIAAFKDRLVVFGRNTTYQVANMNDTANIAMLPISYSTGCVSAQTIQTLASDVIFLSYDGIRVLSASDQYGDVQLGTISEKILPLVRDVINVANYVRFSSCLVRQKNQYRLFYCNEAYDSDQQKGFIGTLRPNSATGAVDWQWSTTEGLPIACIASTASPFVGSQVQEERLYHGGFDGYVYSHDAGNDFGSNPVQATCTLNEIDYGDPGLKKTLHYVRLFGTIDGVTDTVRMSIRYDYGSNRVMQPGYSWSFDLDQDLSLSLYGTAVYGTDTYSGAGGQNFFILSNVEGSGFTNNFTLYNLDSGYPYKLDSMYVDVRLGAKQ